jgi:hypothetical protein
LLFQFRTSLYSPVFRKKIYKYPPPVEKSDTVRMAAHGRAWPRAAVLTTALVLLSQYPKKRI